jgi:DNA-binding SARP family transcriptional activator
MRCYSRQGQPHLALRQYRACADALHRELLVDPEPATDELARQLRGHQPI